MTVGKHGPIIVLMLSVMCTPLPGTQRYPIAPMKPVVEAQHGVMMVARPGNALMQDVIVTTPGAWQLIPTTPIAGLSQPAQDHVKHITLKATRKPISIAGVAKVHGKRSMVGCLSLSRTCHTPW